MGIHQLFLDVKKAYGSARKETLCNILIEFGIPMNLVRIIILYLSLTSDGVRVGKHMSDLFPIKNGLGKRKWFIAITLQF